jgi:D-Tyr-tRNAtyr deacylase
VKTIGIALTAAGAVLAAGAGSIAYTHAALGTPGAVAAPVSTIQRAALTTYAVPTERGHAGWGRPGWMGGRMGPPGGGFVWRDLIADTAKALGISTAALRHDLKSGTTIAALAQAHNLTATQLETTLEQELAAQIQAAAAAGQIPAQMASMLESRLDTLVTAWVTSDHARMGPWSRGPARVLGRDLVADTAGALDISVTTLMNDLRAGTTVASLAAAHGMTTASLESTLEQKLTAQIQALVTDGQLSSQAAQMVTSHLNAWVAAWVTKTPVWPAPSDRMGLRTLMRDLLTDTAGALHLSVPTLMADLRTGKTPADLAVSQGTTAAALETTLEQELTGQITAAVKAGTLSATLGQRLTDELSVLVPAWVNGMRPGSSGSGASPSSAL